MQSLAFNFVTSKRFGVGAPLLIEEVMSRGHSVHAFKHSSLPPLHQLLECDVLIDMSTITSVQYYNAIVQLIHEAKLAGRSVPLLIDPPEAIKQSMDKHLTHLQFTEFVPESYLLEADTFDAILERFRGDEYVVIKPIIGWGGEGVDRYTYADICENNSDLLGKIIQKYIPITNGIGRLLTINYKQHFSLVGAYTRRPIGWKTDLTGDYECLPDHVNNQLESFAREVSVRSGLYLNGIDYILHDDKYFLLEVNAVPAIREPMEVLGIDVPKIIVDRIESDVLVT